MADHGHCVRTLSCSARNAFGDRNHLVQDGYQDFRVLCGRYDRARNHFQKVGPIGQADHRHYVYTVGWHFPVCVPCVRRHLSHCTHTRLFGVHIRRNRSRNSTRARPFHRQRIQDAGSRNEYAHSARRDRRRDRRRHLFHRDIRHQRGEGRVVRFGMGNRGRDFIAVCGRDRGRGLRFHSAQNQNRTACFLLFLSGLLICVSAGFCIDIFVFGGFRLNYMLIGMAYSATTANLIAEEKTEEMMKLYAPVLNISLVIVIVSLGIPLDYRLIAGAGLFTVIYILSRAVGKTGGAYLGGKITKAEPTVTKYLGLTLLPHSGVSLVFTGIAVNTLSQIDAELSAVLSGTIVAAAIINEIIAVILAKFAFKKAGEMPAELNADNALPNSEAEE